MKRQCQILSSTKNLQFAGGFLILTFANVPAAMGSEC
jgi:hypothetical protein